MKRIEFISDHTRKSAEDLPSSGPVFADPRYADPLISRMAGFLASIGLKTAPVVLAETGFLDGLMISHGVLLIDEGRLAYPGDLLHEAGHLAPSRSAPQNCRRRRTRRG